MGKAVKFQSGVVKVQIEYLGERYSLGTYRAFYKGKVSVPGMKPWTFDDLSQAGRNDKDAAASAISFAGYYTTYNRGDDVPDWAPASEFADEVSDGAEYEEDTGEVIVRQVSKNPSPRYKGQSALKNNPRAKGPDVAPYIRLEGGVQIPLDGPIAERMGLKPREELALGGAVHFGEYVDVVKSHGAYMIRRHPSHPAGWTTDSCRTWPQAKKIVLRLAKEKPKSNPSPRYKRLRRLES